MFISAMKHILVGTDRTGSNSGQLAQLIKNIYREINQEDLEIVDLSKLDLHTQGGPFYGDAPKPESLKNALNQISTSDGVFVLCPEYNGSMPGALKYFIDHLKYPDSFEFRPFCFVGLGGMFGGLRPVEHLQQVFGYRNAFIYPERVFLMNVWKILKDGALTDQVALGLLKSQAAGFHRFVQALLDSQIHANKRPKK